VKVLAECRAHGKLPKGPDIKATASEPRSVTRPAIEHQAQSEQDHAPGFANTISWGVRLKTSPSPPKCRPHNKKQSPATSKTKRQKHTIHASETSPLRGPAPRKHAHACSTKRMHAPANKRLLKACTQTKRFQQRCQLQHVGTTSTATCALAHGARLAHPLRSRAVGPDRVLASLHQEAVDDFSQPDCTEHRIETERHR
jgi:hypothetical protein